MIYKESVKKIVNKEFDKLENEIDSISKELVIREVERLPNKRDSRYSPMVEERYNEHKNTVIEYLKGNLKELGSAEKVGSEESNEFRVVILDNFKMLYIKKNDTNHPVSVGNWMDWWERDHRYYFGVDKERYKTLSLKERANLESQLQLLLWVNRGYYINYADFYLPEDYDRWWWDESSSTKRIKDFNYGNKYWKERLIMSELTGKDIFDITTTGMPFYDVMLGRGNVVGKYKNDLVGYFRENKGLVFEIVWMSPEEYLKKSYDIHNIEGRYGDMKFDDYMRETVNIDLVEKYRERVLEGSKIPLVVLDYSNMSQEGRHRSVVAMELEVEEIPVLVVKTYQDLETDVNKIRKLLGLKKTDFIVDEDATEHIGSWCDTSREGNQNTICYIENIDDAIHEGVHAFFEELSEEMFLKLGEEEYVKNVSNIVTDDHLEETVSRIIEYNYHKKQFPICTKEIMKTVNFNSKFQPYEDKVLGEKIMKLYTSIYLFNCITEEDIPLYEKVKSKLNPKEVYNIIVEDIESNKLM